MESHKRLNILILSFGNKGGMLHYTIHFTKAIRTYIDNVILVIRDPETALDFDNVDFLETFPMVELLTSSTIFQLLWRVLYNIVSLLEL